MNKKIENYKKIFKDIYLSDNLAKDLINEIKKYVKDNNIDTKEDLGLLITKEIIKQVNIMWDDVLKNRNVDSEEHLKEETSLIILYVTKHLMEIKINYKFSDEDLYKLIEMQRNSDINFIDSMKKHTTPEKAEKIYNDFVDAVKSQIDFKKEYNLQDEEFLDMINRSGKNIIIELYGIKEIVEQAASIVLSSNK